MSAAQALLRFFSIKNPPPTAFWIAGVLPLHHAVRCVPAGGRCCGSQWAGLRWWWELLVRRRYMSVGEVGGAVVRVQWYGAVA